MDNALDILGIGNAIMDVIVPTDDAFLTTHNIVKGGMTLIEESRAAELTRTVASKSPTEIAGGSAANTIVGTQGLGIKSGYIGKVADDAIGMRFAENMHEAGVDFHTKPLSGGPTTAQSFIMVTPDAERSMSTFLGASVYFGPEDLDSEFIAGAKILYLEGYLFDREDAKAAFVKASEIARAAGNKVALTLSDSFCVDRHRASFAHLIEHHTDILFANEAEICALYETNFEAACEQLATHNILAAITRGQDGSVIIQGETRHIISAEPAVCVVDTTGAGDQYAAGFLAGLIKGLSLPACGRAGSLAAAEVISHYGARPEQNLSLN